MKNTLLTICICVSAIFTGCKDQVDVSKAIIGDWTIVEADGIAVETGFETPSISFKEDGNVYGNTSINKFFGGFYFNRICFIILFLIKNSPPSTIFLNV